jgi:tRNA modification GTPase
VAHALTDTTIAACATPQGSGGVAVIRISGPETQEIIRKIVAKADPIVSKPRTAHYRIFLDPFSGEKLDTGLILFFAGPASFTGEDSAEIQCHGSPLLVQHILRVLFECGCHPAQPGEFSKRAYLNGKLDLIQAEAISDLITATSERALKLASEQLEGKLSSLITQLGEPLRDILAELEASLDFPEEDITPETTLELVHKLTEVRKTCASLVASYDTGRRIRDGFRVVLWGLPNSGKSSLLNTLLGEERAIVTNISGTTRDTLEEELSLNGTTCVLCDTAGINESSDIVEKIGIERARKRLSWADLVLFLVDSTAEHEQTPEITSLEEELQALEIPVWLLRNKSDMCSQPSSEHQRILPSFYQEILALSAKRGDGVETLKKKLKILAEQAVHGDSDAGSIITNERHRSQLTTCLYHVDTALAAFQMKTPYEMVSEDIRASLRSLEELIGVTTPDEILGRIFSKFCIGK